ncbi:MAG: DNA-3-methyladenine glycosylase I [Actinomycetota bacterium]
MTRCSWAESSEVMLAYHDDEWGMPTADDRLLFEKICLEGFQSGLSWSTILTKRDAFRRVFADFDVERVAAFGDAEIAELVTDPSIIRHAGKIRSTINNARRCRELIAAEGSLAIFIWRYEPRSRLEVGATRCPESEALARDLKKRGWTFVGPTTMYAMMQSLGMVNDHEPDCPTRTIVDTARARFARPG